MYNIALIGNANCGKTTLFNLISDGYGKVGNFSGVTVEEKSGYYKKDENIKITDLPGVYSLTPKSRDEYAVKDYLINNKPDCIINVVDGNFIERNLYLTVLLRELNIPMIVAVNYYDEMKKNWVFLDEKKLSDYLGIKVIKISALKNYNVEKAVNLAMSEITERKVKAQSLPSGNKEIYEYIKKGLELSLNLKEGRAEKFTYKADKILTGKYTGLPVFVFVMFTVYFLSLKLGGLLSFGLENGIESLSDFLLYKCESAGIGEFLSRLLSEGIVGGVGTVISFLPQILILFFLLSVLEQTGYMARVSFILDRIFRSFSLSGKSVIPLILSCGCTVGGVMATRTIENGEKRILTVAVCPFMPCGAKSAVFAYMAKTFFNGSALVATSLYFLGIIIAAAVGYIFGKYKKNKSKENFILEMPFYRLPRVKDLFYTLKNKTKEFFLKAGTVILIFSVVNFILINVGIKGYTYGVTEDGFLYKIGNAIKYIFYPLGFCSWQSSAAVLSGIIAKEAVIEVLSQNPIGVFNGVFSAYSFCAFILLMPPCIAALSQIKRETGNKKTFIKITLMQTVIAYSVSMLINLTGILYNINILLLFAVVFVIIIAIILVKLLKKRKRGNKVNDGLRFNESGRRF